MAHEITTTDNMFSVRQMPWMGLLDGQVKVLGDYPTREEAQAIAHPWEPTQVEMFYEWPGVNEAGEPVMEKRRVESSVLNLRDDTGAELAAVNRTYENVTNGEMYDIAEALQGSDQDVHFETGGSLAGGKRVWLMLKLNEPLILKGDKNNPVIPFYGLQNNHDGLGAFRGQATLIRVVCANTSKMADLDAQSRGTEFRFSHTARVSERIEEAKLALAGWRENIDAWRLLNEHLLTVKVTDEGVRDFVERFIPEPLSAMTSDRVKNNIERARGDWMGVYNSVTCADIQNTAYGLVQASSEFTEHVRRANSQEARFKRAVLDRNTILADAVALAEEAALV